MQEVNRLFDLIPYIKEKKHKRPIFGYKINGEWELIDIDDYEARTNDISYGLMYLGIQPNDKVAIISNNCPEWNMLDLAIMQIGAITIPIYATISKEDYAYILDHSEIKALFIEGKELHTKISPILHEIPNLKHIYTFSATEGFDSLEQLQKIGSKNSNPQELERRKAAVKEHDMATIIYTSGTTGKPKGVMLSHANFINNFKNLTDIPADWSERALSFLPLSHVYERMITYLFQYINITVYYAESLATIADNIKEVKPNIMSCVPRLLEKIYDKLYISGQKLSAPQQKLYYWAFENAKDYVFRRKTPLARIKHKIADVLVYRKWRAAIGGEFDILVSGGSAIQPHISAFFLGIGMPVFEGYGLSETSPVIAVSRKGKNQHKPGTVGPIMPGVEVKIDFNNEICCRGHNVMLGYYKDPEKTQEVIDKDGWFHTGDMGMFTPEGLLRITGRLKSVFKTSFGKYINPQKIEELFCESPYIENIVVVGENQKFPAALINPDLSVVKKWAKSNSLENTNINELLNNPELKHIFKQEVQRYNIHLGDWEQIKRFELIPDEWTVENGILTPTQKIKRPVVHQRYKDIIEKMFA